MRVKQSREEGVLEGSDQRTLAFSLPSSVPREKVPVNGGRQQKGSGHVRDVLLRWHREILRS